MPYISDMPVSPLLFSVYARFFQREKGKHFQDLCQWEEKRDHGQDSNHVKHIERPFKFDLHNARWLRVHNVVTQRNLVNILFFRKSKNCKNCKRHHHRPETK